MPRFWNILKHSLNNLLSTISLLCVTYVCKILIVCLIRINVLTHPTIPVILSHLI